MIRLARGRIRPAVREIQHQSPLAFLYPSIGSLDASKNPFERSRNEKTPVASTSYSTLQPSKKVNAEEAVPYRRESAESLEAALQYRKRGKAALSDRASSIDSRYDSASYVGVTEAQRQRNTSDRFGGGDESDPKGKRPERQSIESKRQDILLGRTFVRDIMKKPLESAFTVNEVELLDEVSETYFRDAENEVELLDKLLPDLALAYLHVGQDQRALALLERASKIGANSESYTSTPLHSWKKVLATAFTRGKYELTADFVKAASGGLNEEDDWAMLARFEALLLHRRFKRSESSATDSVNVDQYWKEYEAHDRKAPELVFTTLLAEQVKDGKAEAVRQTLMATREHGHVIDGRTWGTLLGMHPRGRRKGFLGELAKELDVDGQQAFASVVSHFSSHNNPRRVLLAFRMFGVGKDLLSKPERWIPDFDTMRAVISMFGYRNNPEAAMKFLQLAIDLDVQGDYTASYLAISKALRKDSRPEDALVFASHMVGICLQNQGRPHSLNFHLPKPIVKPSKRCFRECLRVCSTIYDPVDAVEKAREVLLDLIKIREITEGVLQGTVALFKAIMQDASYKQLSTVMTNLSKHALQRSQEDGDLALNIFIDALNSEGAIDQVIVAKREQIPSPSRDARENLEWVTKSHEISNFIGGYSNPTLQIEETPEGRAASLLEAEEMSADPYVHLTPRLTPMAYALRLRVFAVVRQDYGSAVIIYRYMLANGIKPTVHHIAPILEGLVTIDRLEDARAIRDGARQTLSGIDSSLRISAAIIRGHLRRNDWLGVQQELTEMRERRVHPDAFILSMVRMAQMHYKDSKSQNLEKLNETSVKAQESMEPLLKDLENKAHQKIREEYENHVWLQKKMGKKNKNDNSGQIAISSMQKPTKKRLSVQNTTKYYQNLYQSQKHLLALQYLSNSLRAGLVPDDRLRTSIQSHGKFLERDLKENGMIMQTLIDYKGRPRQFPYDKVQAEEETVEARRIARRARFSNRRLANYWGPVAQLWNELREITSGLHPSQIERQKRENQAMEDLLRLIVDFYGSNRLIEEAKEERNTDAESIKGTPIPSTPPH
ncbi:uncharacterized protein FA14DRAFT_173974 [Meira miltonrushii]|uniref:Pentacotripeptide-repeat region of PRORP domain-containing protein n=1 Tax=Meira miltonrushii TaxID=1280837 RepID=A0A316VB07_9BASI|nr:uncharacterized protein FA14DRAFT_173974 [Meira miltonrushii]PWN34278.1 hypothetical protein FA14DRAFT_173974 [Meira miltonrushii]